ncbi:MAG: hypothetical protein Q9164_001898 [Protoblastenia rupestris]
MASKLPPTMKAWQFTSTSPTLEKNLKLNTSAPLPASASSLPADQTLVQVLVVSLNPVDYKFPEIPLLGRLMTGSPATPSIDYAGRVVATGPNSKKVSATDLELGQLVFGRLDGPTKFGTLAEYTIAPRAGCVPIPSGVSVIDAACAASVALTAYQCIIPKIKGGAGERVFINGGSGGTGTFGIQIAKAAGCHVTTSCSGANVELCESLGADTVIDYTSKDVVAELKKMPQFDLVVDNVGLPANLYWSAPSFTKPGAPYMQVGAPAISLGFVYEMLCKTMWPRLLGGGQRPWEFLHLESKVEDYAQIGRWMQEGKVRAVVDEVFGMEDKGPVRAFEKLRTGRTRGKIVVKVAERWDE